MRSFVSLAGIPLHPATQTPKLRNHASNFSTTRKLFTVLPPPLGNSQQQQDDHEEHGSIAADHPEHALDLSETPLPSSSDSVPWYLQVQPLPTNASALPDRQKMPDLPEDPPPLLQTVLEHLSIEVGLDDLTLIDTRKLDPPPALGANLIMVLGTARSEKHLHVSADRFSRWLRTVHKLSPYADGLLGRNELKLKTRRKARRAKLLSSVGNTESGNTDEGIRTSWVCVNVGSIDTGYEAEQQDVNSEGFVGFGGQSSGVKLVVQMLTEEKREELDLESLWGGFLSRQQRKQAREAEKQLQEANEREVGHSSAHSVLPATDPALFTLSSLRPLVPARIIQPRGFHSSSKLQTAAISTEEWVSEYEGLDERTLEPRLSRIEKIEDDLKSFVSAQSCSFESPAQKLMLEAHVRYLKSLPRDDAIEVLGTGSGDIDSTTFLSSFFQSFPLFPELSHWQFRHALISYAIDLQHPSYYRVDLVSLIKEMQSSAISVPVELYESTLRYLAEPDVMTSTGTEGLPALSMDSFMMSLEVLSDMDLYACDIFRESTVIPLIRSLTLLRPHDSMEEKQKNEGVSRLIRLISRRQIHFSKSSSQYHILHALANAEDWNQFWDYWRGIARHMETRSFLLYALMFRSITNTDHQANCAAALQTWLPELELETPAVFMHGDLARTVMNCLLVVVPDLEAQVSHGFSEKSEWVRRWRECLRGLPHSNEVSEDEAKEKLLEHFQMS